MHSLEYMLHAKSTNTNEIFELKKQNAEVLNFLLLSACVCVWLREYNMYLMISGLTILNIGICVISENIIAMHNFVMNNEVHDKISEDEILSLS